MEYKRPILSTIFLWKGNFLISIAFLMLVLGIRVGYATAAAKWHGYDAFLSEVGSGAFVGLAFFLLIGFPGLIEIGTAQVLNHIGRCAFYAQKAAVSLETIATITRQQTMKPRVP
jgi:hypothetical protein